MLLSLMPLSLTRPTKRDTSVLLRLLTPVFTSRARRATETQVTTQPSFCMPRDSKISLSSKDSEISLEFIELPSDSTTIKDSSTLISSTTAHGPSSPLTEDQLSKKSKTKTQSVSSPPSLTQASTSPSKRTKVLMFKTLESGPNSTSLSTMSSPTTSILP